MGKHRHERFRAAFAVIRIDDYDLSEIAKESLIKVTAVWLSADQAEAEVARLNELNSDKSARYFMQYTRLERDA